jgi:hypothetical protein
MMVQQCGVMEYVWPWAIEGLKSLHDALQPWSSDHWYWKALHIWAVIAVGASFPHTEPVLCGPYLPAASHWMLTLVAQLWNIVYNGELRVERFPSFVLCKPVQHNAASPHKGWGNCGSRW